MVGRDANRLDALHRELGGSDRVLSTIADVTSQIEVDDARAVAITRFGHIDLLVVSSGVITGSAFGESIPADWAEMIDVNLCGLLHASQTFTEPLLDSADRGAPADIVLIGAVSTDVRAPRFAVFNALSAAIKQLARALRHAPTPGTDVLHRQHACDRSWPAAWTRSPRRNLDCSAGRAVDGSAPPCCGARRAVG